MVLDFAEFLPVTAQTGFYLTLLRSFPIKLSLASISRRGPDCGHERDAFAKPELICVGLPRGGPTREMHLQSNQVAV